ncbi:glutamyl-tRNA reductase [Streptomyces sp. NPDC058583]|uniref:glutamyl-tRNA reductase n=1 Tax=unclassified Streptomyces TaxID=2593676 RepID=UPI003653F506
MSPSSTMLVLGISHASAPLDLLERLAGTDRPAEDLVSDVTSVDGIDAAVVVSTCNRLEIYAETRGGPTGFGDTGEAAGAGELTGLGRLFAEHTGVDHDEIAPHLYSHHADGAVRHLFAVASGLESVVVGEDQILGQVKLGLERSQRLDRTGRVLAKAVQTALRVGKRARNETGLNEAGRSLATAGLGFFERRVGSLHGKTALVIGAGAFAGVVVAALRRSGLDRVHVANRTPEKAQRLAETTGGVGYDLTDLPELLTEVDVVVGATAATGHLVSARDVEEALAARDGRELFLLDLSLPHNIAPGAAELPGVTFVDLRRIAEEGQEDEISAASVQAAHELIDAEVEQFRTGLRLAGAKPVLTALRTAATEAAEAELDRLARRLDGIDGIDGTVRREIDRSVRRIVDKALHQPTVLVRELAADPDGARHIAAFTRLFAAADSEGGGASTTANAPNAQAAPNTQNDPNDPDTQNDPNDPNAQNETKIEAIA